MRRVLIANRGEIALRIIRACTTAGLETVAVYSDADALAPHVLAADAAVRLGPAPAAESYLDVTALLDAARQSGADAVHPGYGFLSERAHFARAVEDAGLVFIGPPADAIERLGSKTGARRLMEAAGVPVVPGITLDDQSDGALVAAATTLGTPLLVKPAAGGGGIGMKTVRHLDELAAALPQARREAQSAFGNGTLYLERLIDRPRHIEVQVFGDRHGQIVHLFERECSAQRRHQKVVEETPSPAVTPAVRARIGAAAVAAARTVGYQNAGTVEFLLEGEGDQARFYFLEINARLQVEHPITECVVGVDLVRAQLAVAAGAPLPWRQDQLTQRGHALECRVYAEDPARGFLPQAGPLLRYREPSGPGIRIDAGVVEGGTVSVYYDPLLAKLIVHAEDREHCLARMQDALARFEILGLRTNLDFLHTLIAHPRFVAGQVDTGFLDRHLEELCASDGPVPPEVIAAAAWHASLGGGLATTATVSSSPGLTDPFETMRGWRG
ncbi:MAG TPA: biotin carboxylase N-terminal domain-containing protein [Vicinamibacterales bacterium]|nr:biotin carboxylase N-terminal domain-containing protein [Vicinamibacterales bacterium]